MPFSLYPNRNQRRRRRSLLLLTLLAMLALASFLMADPARLPRLLSPLGLDLQLAESRADATAGPTAPSATAPTRGQATGTRTATRVPGPSATPGSEDADRPSSLALDEPSPTKGLAGSARPRPTRTPRAVASPSKTLSKTPSTTPSTAADQLARAKGGPMELAPPLLSFDRAFTDDLEQRSSAFYPYGTTAGGQYLLHHGIDISNPLGTEVRAVAAGEVIYAGDDLEAGIWGPEDEPYPAGFYGRLVVIRHEAELEGEPLYSLYGHLSEIALRRRQRASAGQTIGRVGSAGIALGPHLHLEFRAGGTDYASTRNPELLLRPLEGSGLIVGRVSDPAGRPIHGIDVGLYALAEDGRETWLRQATTYPAERINSISSLGENFVFGDLAPGSYVVAAQPGGGRLSAEVRVLPQRASGILLQR